MTRVAAGAFGFLTLIQIFDRPEYTAHSVSLRRCPRGPSLKYDHGPIVRLRTYHNCPGRRRRFWILDLDPSSRRPIKRATGFSRCCGSFRPLAEGPDEWTLAK